MLDFFHNLFRTDFWPHGQCYLWKPDVLWLHVVSDLLITISYYSIPLFLWYFIRKRKDVPYRWLFALFALFILACGTTHLMEVWTLWHPVYRVSGLIKLFTGLLSAATAVTLVKLLPVVAALPSYNQVRGQLLDLSYDAIFVTEMDGTIVLWNRGAAEIYGWSQSEAVGRISQEILKAEFPQPIEQVLADLVSHARWEGELQQTCRDGRVVTMATRWALQRDQTGRPWRILKINQDISAKKEAEAELNRFFQVSRDLLCVARFDGNFKRANPAWEEVLGYRANELAGTPLLNLVNADDRQETALGLEHLRTESTPQMFENRLRRRDGSTLWFSWQALAIPGEGLIYATAHDITHRKHTEFLLKHMNEALERRVRERTEELQAVNRELESFSYSVSHDLRAPLRQIDGFARLLREQLGGGTAAGILHNLQRIQDGATHMGRLVEELLNLGRMGRQELRRRRTELEPLVAQVVEQLTDENRDRRIEWHIEPLEPVDCDPSLMQAVFTNLLSNAVKFTHPRSPARIQVGQRAENGTTVLFVADNGVGFNMKYADKLFGIFQRLHRAEEFPGTGVGLATVQRIIQKHGGRIWAEAEPDHGATFHFTLPPTAVDQENSEHEMEVQHG